MSKVPRGAFVIRTGAQRAALAAPLRLEILEQCGVLGSASIREIADRMGRRPDSLYYHVKLLAKAGILVDAGTRRAGKGEEALYRPVATVIAMSSGPKRANAGAVRDALRAQLRLAHREAMAAIGSDVMREGPGRTSYVRRLPLVPDAALLAQINALLDQIEQKALRAARRKGCSAEGRRVALTLVLAPMAGRAHHAPRRSRIETPSKAAPKAPRR